MPAENRRTILFLPKWYPDRKQDQNGNFIQQHAQAVSQFSNVIVLYANVSDFPGSRLMQFEFKKDGGIPTFYFYYKQRITGIPAIDKILKLFLYFSCLSRGFRFVNRMYGRPDLLHVHVLLRTGLFAWYKCLSIGLPYLITEHWTLYLPQNAHKIGFLRKFLTRLVVKNAAAVHTVSENLKQAMLQLGFRNKNYVVIPNVVDTSTFYPSNHSVFSSKVKFLNVAILNDQAKNQSGLIQAFHKLLQTFPKAELRIIGFGPSEYTLKEQAKNLRLLNVSVFFEGKKEAAEVAQYLRNTDVFVLPSHYETFGVVLIEAMACGVPVIASKVGGVPEVFGEEQGILIPPRNEKALLKALQFMCNHHQDFSKEKLRAYAQNRYSYQAVGQQFAEVYETVLQASKIPA